MTGPLHAIALVALLALPVAAGAQWTEGVHYERIETGTPPDGDRIEVLYAFWYGCPSCFNLEPHVRQWRRELPEDVEFVQVAASMSPSWRVHARAFYTADALEVADRVHGELFNAIHMRRQPLNTVDSIAGVFAEYADVDRETFLATFNSFNIDARMRRGDQRLRRLRLTAVPTVVVNGRYRTDPGRAQGFENVMKVVDHLIELERRERAAQPAVR